MGVLRSLVALASLAVGVACGGKADEIEQNAARVAVGSERDATTPVRVPALGIALDAPAAGWKLMEERDARALADGARIGAIGPEPVSAVVIAKPTVIGDVDALAGAHVAMIFGEAPSLSEVRVGEVSGRSYAHNDGGVRRAGALWLKDGMLFELRAWGLGDAVDAAVPSLLASMTFFPREGTLSDIAARDQRGADWRVKDNKYDNGASGLSVEVTKGLRIVVGEALLTRDPAADVMIEGTTVPLAVTFASEPVTTAAARASRKEAVANEIGGESAEPLTVEVFGQQVALAQRAVGAEWVAYGDVCTEDWCHAVVARYGKGGAPLVAAAFASASVLSPERRKAILAELDEAPRHHCVVGDDASLRGSTFRHFTQDFTLTAPSPAWSMYAGALAKRRVEAATVFLEARRFGLAAALVVDEAAGDDAEVHHRAVVDALQQRAAFKASGKSRKVKGNLVTQGSGALALSFVVATQIVGGRGLQLVVWGEKKNVDANDKEIVALIEGLSSGVPKAIETPPGGYLDRRLGVSAAMPVGWRMEVSTPTELSERGAFVTWEKDRRHVGMMAMCMPPGAGVDWSSRYLEQRLRERIGALARGSEATQRRPVAGREANVTSWHAALENVDVVVFHRDNGVYAIAAVDHLEEGLSKAVQSFAFID